MEVPQETKNRTTISPTYTILGHIYERMKTRETCTSMFMAALYTIAKIWNQPGCPIIDDWLKKIWYIYTAIKKKKNLN
jgi:hypothetical protein